MRIRVLAVDRKSCWRVELVAALLVLLGLGVACSDRVETPPTESIPSPRYAATADGLERLIRAEMEDKGLPALAIVLVDDREVVWSACFGTADAEKKVPAELDTLYRVGSVSKLFTTIAVMQLVERGVLDLDVPVSRYLEDFLPGNPFGEDVTLRQLLSHRSGLVREPPVGHYFDSGEPSLEETVRSLNRTRLVYRPRTRTKYSNAAVAVVGRVLEETQDRPFAEYLQTGLLESLGMTHSYFALPAEMKNKVSAAWMWTVDGREFPAPRFDLGTVPAGSLYTTVGDLGRFLTALVAGGVVPGGRILNPETLQQMWTPQFTEGESGFGLGFRASRWKEHRWVGHGGAVYGFTTHLAMLPDQKLAVVTLTTMDASSAVTTGLADRALEAMLAVREGRELPLLPEHRKLNATAIQSVQGVYGSGDERVEVQRRGDRAYLIVGAVPVPVSEDAEGWLADGRRHHRIRLELLEEGLEIGGRVFDKAEEDLPDTPPQAWRDLIGEYGWDYNTLYILEKEGRLHALIEWFFLYPLDEISRDVFAFPDSGLYQGEELIFKRDSSGQVTEVEAAGVRFQRRQTGSEQDVFTINPIRPVEELRRTAAAAQPPPQEEHLREPDLVDLSSLDPSLRFDIRYAGNRNFMGAPFYPEARAFLQQPAAEALLRAHQSLEPRGYGLLIHDAYRPWYVTKMFWDATPSEMKIFVADPRRGSRHNRGAAVDLTLYERKSGAAVEMVSGYDEFSERAAAFYPGGTSRQRWLRDLLRSAMEEQGFDVYDFEWWHFDHREWRFYPVLNLTFEELEKGG